MTVDCEGSNETLMNNLRDKLLKAGLVSEQDARRAEAGTRGKKRGGRRAGKDAKGRRVHERSFEKGEPGEHRAVSLPREQRLSPEELAAAKRRRQERESEQALAKEREENRRRAAEQRAKANDIRMVAEHLSVDVSGDVVFHFTTRKKKLQRMLVSKEAAGRLENGELAIIEHPMPHAIEFSVVPREGADAVLKIDPRAVRFFNRSETERYGIGE